MELAVGIIIVIAEAVYVSTQMNKERPGLIRSILASWGVIIIVLGIIPAAIKWVIDNVDTAIGVALLIIYTMIVIIAFFVSLLKAIER